MSLIIVIALATLFAYGCSGLFDDPREQANEAISTANEAVVQHNESFRETRRTYDEVKEQIESGGGSADDENAFRQEKRRITAAQENLEEARAHLEDAQQSLSEVQDLDVEQPIKRYANLLDEAMEAQIAAESSEIQFYGLLVEDPTLEDRRDRAEELLTQAGDSYQEAENSYEEAQELADSNPDLLGPTVSETTPENEANN
ncbi:MAG: hypothetical protein ACFB50_04790 [Rubrobacteraceae bacterium]